MTLRILFTGGSCAGKTEILPKVADWLRVNDFKVQTRDESATSLLNEGVKPKQDFQRLIFERQLVNEVVSEKTDIVLFDRGFLDQQAYCTREQFKNLCNEFNLDVESIYNRYDVVIHLESNAQHTHVSEGRLETKEQALVLEKVTEFWTMQHKNAFYIEAQETLEDKLRKVIDVVNSQLPTISLF